jgi:hypothetical protein
MSWHSSILSSFLLVALLGCAAHAADAGVATAAHVQLADAHATQQLLAELPRVPEISQQGQRIVWQGNGSAATIVGIDAASGDPLLETTMGPLRVARWVVEQHHLAVIPALPGLVARASAAQCTPAALVLQDGLLTGPSLRTADAIVVREGVMRKQSALPDDRAQEIAQVSRAIAAVSGDISRTGLDDLGRKALLYVIAKLDGRDASQAADDFSPSFARRVVRHGWLRRWFRAPEDAAAVAALEQAVAAVDQQRTIASFNGDGVQLMQKSDAFGRGGWIYASPSTVLVAKTEIHPEFLGFLPELLVVVGLPPGSDPAQAMGSALSARIYQGSTLLAQWSATAGFSADPIAWQRMVGAQRGNLAPDAIPAHILISGLDGDIVGLAVAKGLLRPVEDATLASAERFINDAALLLPDCAHLDLIGEYLFTYVYPTPEAAHPELIGNPQNKGDVQQTVWQTCATSLGGIMHGDCADIAELYQVITKAQGRNSFIIGLPEHAACAWADQEGQGWKVSLLQTGPPLAFTGNDLPTCLVKTYSGLLHFFRASMRPGPGRPS